MIPNSRLHDYQVPKVNTPSPAIRFGGFHIVNMSSLHIGLQVLYAATMFAPPYPIMRRGTRRTNVYEETSIASYRVYPARDGNILKYYGEIARRQLARKALWILALAVFIITTVEADHFRQDPVQNSTFKIMFEIASAFCNSGVSVGWSDENYSFSGGWHDASKVILCAVMLRGRHRDIPDAIDQAVLLPSEALAASQAERAGIPPTGNTFQPELAGGIRQPAMPRTIPANISDRIIESSRLKTTN